MRKVFAPILALAGHAVARAVNGGGGVNLPNPAPVSEITFKASNGSDVVLNVGTGFTIAEDARNLPSPFAKLIKIEGADSYTELCTVRATRQAGSGMPRRDDCQALYDYVKGTNVFIYFEEHDVELRRWAEIFWVGTCAFRAQTYTNSVVFSNADIARFLDRALSREAWTIDGKMSASGEADCAASKGEHGKAPMFWRLQERAAPIPPAPVIKPRESEPIEPVVFESFNDIPQNTSAYVLNDGVRDVTEPGSSVNGTTLSKRFKIYFDGDKAPAFCKALWLSTDVDGAKSPLRSDCAHLLNFVKTHKATVIFKERDLNFWAKFAAHGTCGLSFMTTKDRLMITQDDMAIFLQRVVNWHAASTPDGGMRAKGGVSCNFGKGHTEWWKGEFRLFWRDPNLPIGQLERRDEPNMPKPLTASSLEPEKEPIALADDDSSINWADVSVPVADGTNATFQINTNGLVTSPEKLARRLEYIDTPLGPSKRCNGKNRWMGGAHKDSATIEDCKKLRDFIGKQRMYWRFNEEEIRNGRLVDPVVATPIAKYGTCHFAYGPRYYVVIGNMDIERILDGAIEHLDNTHGRMRGWSYTGCDIEGQFGYKTDGYWKIYP